MEKKISEFKKKGISVLKGWTEEELVLVLREANKAYYNQQPFFTDSEYDIVKEFAEVHCSDSVVVAIGAPVERNKVTLPYFMGSMNKIKPDTGALASWSGVYSGPYVLSCKLDGVSGLYICEKNGVQKLFTRGDGKVGQDISHFIPYLRLPKKKGVVIRGELIIPKSVFHAKYKDLFANPRNMVAGILNQKTISNAIADVHFVAYELIVPTGVKPSDQLAFLQGLENVECVFYKKASSLSNELLSSLLIDWRANYSYEIDGVIVTQDSIIKERKEGNPEHAVAFKMVLSEQVAEAKVVDVIWTPSKDGYLKPRIQIEPVHLGGVRIEYATGFNGAFVLENGIGIGAVVELVRSGDVIPHIRQVVTAASIVKMPDVPFVWNATHVDVLLENVESNETVREKNIAGFFRGIGVEGLSEGNVARIVEAGFDSIAKIVVMREEDFLQVSGFKSKMAAKLCQGIREKLEEASIVTLMAASNLFGRGFSVKKLELIWEACPHILLDKALTVGNPTKVEQVADIKGMGLASAKTFVSHISLFTSFLKEIGQEKKLFEKGKKEIGLVQGHPLFGKTVVLTGTRDKAVVDLLQRVGAKQGATVGKSTFLLVVKNGKLEMTVKMETTGKLEEAKSLGIPILGVEEFISKYNV